MLKTLKHEMLHDCHSLCFSVSSERDTVSHVLLFVRLIVVFSSHMDVKVHATHGLYNVLVQLATCSDAIGCNTYPFPSPHYRCPYMVTLSVTSRDMTLTSLPAI
jgi:hypothetical protein